MPIYEYECRACGHEWDELQKITDGPKRKCPECGRLQAKKLISRSTFVLKGSGWYVTDYGKGTGGQAGERKSSTSTKKATTKTEKKPAKKTTPKKDD